MLLHRRSAAAAALGAAAVAASLVPPAPSYAADTCTGSTSVQVDVVGAIGVSQRFSPQQICDLYDRFGVRYQVRLRPGADPISLDTTPPVLSIQGLLGSVRLGSGSTLPLSSVTFVQVLDGDGHPHSLDEQQVRDPGSIFQGGLVPAVWWQASTGHGPGGSTDSMWYIRPLMGPSDVNGADWFAGASGQPLQVVVHTSGMLLSPSITTTPTTVDAGQPVSFAVSYADPQPTTRLQYHWTFGDGATSTAAAPRHTFTTSCTCLVRLDVTGSDTSSGSSFTSVQVGPAPTQTTTTHPTSGPTKGGGHKEGGPTSGPTTLAPTASATPTATPSATSSPTVPAVGPAGGPAAPLGGGGQTPGTSSGPTSGPTSGPSRGGRDASKNDEVAGRLLLASQVYAAPQDVPQATQAASARAPQRLSRSWWWTLWLLVPLLVGLGMAAEAVRVRRRVTRMGT